MIVAGRSLLLQLFPKHPAYLVHPCKIFPILDFQLITHKEKPNLTTTEPIHVSLMQHTLGLGLMLVGGTVLCAFLLDLVGLPLRPWTVGPLVLVLITGFSWNLWRKIKKGYYSWGNWDFAEFALFALVVSGFLVYALWLGRPNLLPVGTTVDAPHQYGLAEYISESGKLPIHATDQRTNLQDGIEYPPAFVTVASLVSQTTTIDLIHVIYPLTALFAAIAAGATFAIVSLLLVGKPWRLPLAGLAAGFTLIPSPYTFGSFTEQNYFAQVMAQAMLMLSLFYLLMWRRDQNIETLALFGLAVSSLIIGYPTWAVIPLGAFGLAVLFWQGKSWLGRFYWLLGLLLPLGLLSALFLKDRLKAGLGTVSNEGQVVLPDLSLYSWPVLLLAFIGLILSLGRGPNQNRIVALFCGFVAAEGFGFWLLKTAFNIGSYYSLYKLFYPAAYLFPVLAVLFLGFLINHQDTKIPRILNKFSTSWWFKSVLGVLLFGLFLAITWINHPRPDRPYPVITQDGYNVANWMRNNLKISEYSVGYAVKPGTPAYWLQVGIFKQPRSRRTNDLLNLEPLTFQGWFYTPDSNPYLFIEDINQANLDERTQILYQNGSAAVLTRTPAFQQQFGLRPNLTIQYKSELINTGLIVRSEATMSEDPSSWLLIGLEVEPAAGGETVFKAYTPVEYGRPRKQYLGISVSLPTLRVSEFYSNNLFPTPPDPKALPPGDYKAFLVLQKKGVTIERRRLLDFTHTADGNIIARPEEKVVVGQYLFEGRLPEQLPSINPLTLQLDNESFRLDGLSLPTTGKAGETLQVSSQWEAITPTARSYQLGWVWLDSTGQIVNETDAVPLNGLYPTWMWPNNGPANIQQGLKLPTKAGRYQLALFLVDNNNQQKSVLGKLDKFIEVS